MLKKKDIFFQTFENMAENLLETAVYFQKVMKSGHIEDTVEFAKIMKDYEHKGDHYVHTVIAALNKTFITPIERDDIMDLITSLDDVLDTLETCASRFEMYEIHKVDPHIAQFADIVLRSCQEINSAIRLLTSKKMLAIRQHTIRINELENEGDDLLRKTIKLLFSKVTDPIELIKWKELFELLESTTDDCEDVANTLETIIMGNS